MSEADVAPFIDSWADTYAIPREIAYGLVQTESGFNPDAVGAAGEIGLWQIEPTTAALLGYTGDVAGLHDPDVNSQYGGLYLRNQFDRYGNWPQALSAYNAGSAITGNADYVARVQAAAAQWAATFGGPSGAATIVGIVLAGLIGWSSLKYLGYL